MGEGVKEREREIEREKKKKKNIIDREIVREERDK